MPAFQPFFSPADAIAAVKGPGAKAPEVLITTTLINKSTIYIRNRGYTQIDTDVRKRRTEKGCEARIVKRLTSYETGSVVRLTNDKISDISVFIRVNLWSNFIVIIVQGIESLPRTSRLWHRLKRGYNVQIYASVKDLRPEMIIRQLSTLFQS